MKRILTLLLCLFLLSIPSLCIAAEIHEAAKSGDLAKLKILLDKDPGFCM